MLGFGANFKLKIMRKLTVLILAFLLLGTALLTACGGESSMHASSQGHMPEQMLPSDTGLVFSYSLLNIDQASLLLEMEESFGEEGGLSSLVEDSLNENFENMDYEEDFLPAFGERFRLVFASRPGASSEEVDAFSVVTLQDPSAMEVVLEDLVSDGKLEEKKLSSVDAYVNEESGFYGSVWEDLMLIANTPDGLVEMMNLEESLWYSERYQDWVGKIGDDQLFYGIVFTDLYEEDVELAGGLGVNAASLVTDSQALVVAAAEDGFDFDVYVQGDETAMDEIGVNFNMVTHMPAYLNAEVPATDLMAYYEAYGLQEMADYVDEAGGSNLFDTLSTFFRSYFGMDFDDEILSFMNKGYVFALHKNGEGLMPGITIYSDVSGDVENAQEFMTQLDTQVDGLTMVLDAALPGAVLRGTASVNGYELDMLEIDLSQLEREGDSPLPAVVTSSEIQLIFGLMDDRLLITTAAAWENGGSGVSAGELYLGLKDMVDAPDGLVLVDAMNMSSFAGTLRALREQLDLGISEDSLGFEEFLEDFQGAIMTSEVDDYEGHFSGFLKLKD